jgi:hypothetical protein
MAHEVAVKSKFSVAVIAANAAARNFAGEY